MSAGKCTSWAPAAAISSRMTASIFALTRSPSGSHAKIPAACGRMYPARISRRWLATSAPAGSSRSVRRKKELRRVTTRVKLTAPAYTGLMPSRRPRLAPGAGDGLSASLAALAGELELPGPFSAAAQAEAEASAREVPTDPDAAGLADLRDIPLITIDPAGSQALDQALHLERTGDGAVL